MTRLAVRLSVLASAVLGCWLPSLWLPAPPPKTHSLSLPALPASPSSPSPTLASAVRGASSPMAKLQAVMTAVAGHRLGPGTRPAHLDGLDFDVARDLAAFLAGEAAGRHVKDPAAFLQSVREANDSGFSTAAILAWADADPDAALTALFSPAGVSVPGAIAGIKRLAARAPDKMLAALKASRSLACLSDARVAALDAFAQKDPDFARAALQYAPDDSRGGWMHTLLGRFAVRDPRAALAWYQKLSPEEQSDTSAAPIFSAWALTDPAAAFEACQQAGMGSRGGREIILTWAGNDPATYIPWALSNGRTHGDGLEVAFESLASGDGPRAVAMLAGLPSHFQKSLLLNIARSWADYDPSAALTWARSLPPEDSALLIAGMAYRLHSLPSQTLRALANEAGAETHDGFNFLRAADPAEAQAVLAAMPLETVRTISAGMVENLSSSSPAEAAHYLDQLLSLGPPPPASEDHAPASGPFDPEPSSGDSPEQYQQKLSEKIAEISATWAARDPASASAWVDQLPPGPAQLTAAANLALTWARHDLPAARAWVENFPPGETRDIATAQLTRVESATAPPPDHP